MRLLASAVALSLLLPALPALAASTDVACWNRDVERMDYYVNPPEGGDNQFFTAATTRSDNVNVTLLYPAKSTMREFPVRLYRIRALGGTTGSGCDNTFLNNLQYFMPTDVPAPAGPTRLQGLYQPVSSTFTGYPDPGPTYSGGGGQSDGLVAGKVYRYLKWPANDASGVAEDPDTACNALAPLSDDRRKTCVQCLATRGYWLNNTWSTNQEREYAGIFTTNFLRFYPPKWTLLSLAYKRLVNGPLLSVLREGVIATNGSTGGQVIQMMLPQSCGGTGRPLNQKQAAIDNLRYTSDANPLAEMLFNAAWFMGGQENPWFFSNASTRPGTAMQSGKSGPCTGCTGDFLVLFSDRRGDSANPTCVKDALTGALPPHCTAEQRCNDLGMGSEDDGNDFMRPSYFGGTDSAPYSFSGFPGGAPQTPGGTCQMDFADDVARWMHTNSVSVANPASKITTYVVVLGDKDNPNGELSALKEISRASDTNPILADNFRDLEKGIEDVMKLIITRATSFSAAAITSVQTRGYTSAFIPRFNPGDGAQWPGSLSRYQLFSEFSAGCTEADYGKKNALNPNGNSSCNDVYLRDKNLNFVGEGPNGDFVQLDDTQPWTSTGWPLKVKADGTYYAAIPVWEASAQLASRQDKLIAGDSSAKRRNIYTVAPDGTTGQYATGLVEFKAENAATIAPLLKLGGVTGTLCQTLSGYTRNTYATEADCARDVIRFVHGEDVLRQNPFNRTFPQPTVYKSRPGVLGDIFHSTPVLVVPPVATFLCQTGFVNQCVTPLFTNVNTTPGGADAYQAYVEQYKNRDQFVLVGANDGMLHAFHAGTFKVSSTPGVASGYDMGTGEELWAFIPPETLPKLIRYVVGERHELMVDGTAMVRDVWVDGSGSKTADRFKQADEYHTVAVVGQREGGRSYFALDVTNPTSPRFLWAAPAPGTRAGLAMGGSWNDLGPAPPPIGPVAEYDPDGVFAVGTTKARERWVVAFGGGYDPALIRGRAIYMQDVWTGQLVYRFAHADASASDDPRKQLFPVAAPVALVDGVPDFRFDLAVVGDTAGQLWAIDMYEPGRDTDGDGLYDNWTGARVFVQFKGDKFSRRSPFFQRAAISMSTSGSYIRAFLGAGDRDNLKAPAGGVCSLSNLMACVRKNCSVSVASTRYRVGPAASTSGHWIQGGWSTTKDATAPTSSLTFSSTAQSASCSDVADVKLDYSVTCSTDASFTSSSKAYCDWGTTLAGADCTEDSGRPPGVRVNYTVPVENARFYSIKLFGDGNRARFLTDQAKAKLFDAAALTDSDLLFVGGSTAADTPSPAPSAKVDGNGWYIKHTRSADEKTASSAVLLNNCVFWNTLNPNASTVVACNQTTLPPDTAYFYQANALGGFSDAKCATTRSAERTTYTAPQQPSPVVSVNPTTGKVRYGVIDLPPGSQPISVTVGEGDLIGGVHWLEVPQGVHECRHGTGACE